MPGESRMPTYFEQPPTRYDGLQAHWRYVTSLAAGDPSLSALVIASFDFGLPNRVEIPLAGQEYEAEVVAAQSYDAYRASETKIEDGGLVRFTVDPMTQRYHIGKLFFKHGVTHNLNNYALAISAQREVIVYTDDGIYFMNGSQMIDLRAAEQPQVYGDRHWDIGLRDVLPLATGQPWQFDEQHELPAVQGFEILIATANSMNSTVLSMPTLGPDVFSNARSLYEAGRPPASPTNPD